MQAMGRVFTSMAAPLSCYGNTKKSRVNHLMRFSRKRCWVKALPQDACHEIALLLVVALAAQRKRMDGRSPVRVIATSPPGGSVDLLARIAAEEFAKAFGQPFHRRDRPGANNIGAKSCCARTGWTAAVRRVRPVLSASRAAIAFPLLQSAQRHRAGLPCSALRRCCSWRIPRCPPAISPNSSPG